MQFCWWLDLAYTQVTDSGLEHLAGLTKLRTLGLANTQITDAGLEHLGKLTNLESLGLYNTRVTKDGVERFRKAIGGCDIWWTPPAEEPAR